jgi:microcystin-dependent protein
MTETTMPSHNHVVNANNLDGDKAGPGGKLLAAAPAGGTGNETIYSTAPADRQMAEEMIAPSGGGLSFPITDPKLGLLHCISTGGTFPSRN